MLLFLFFVLLVSAKEGDDDHRKDEKGECCPKVKKEIHELKESEEALAKDLQGHEAKLDSRVQVVEETLPKIDAALKTEVGTRVARDKELQGDVKKLHEDLKVERVARETEDPLLLKQIEEESKERKHSDHGLQHDVKEVEEGLKHEQVEREKHDHHFHEKLEEEARVRGATDHMIQLGIDNVVNALSVEAAYRSANESAIRATVVTESEQRGQQDHELHGKIEQVKGEAHAERKARIEADAAFGQDLEQERERRKATDHHLHEDIERTVAALKKEHEEHREGDKMIEHEIVHEGHERAKTDAHLKLEVDRVAEGVTQEGQRREREDAATNELRVEEKLRRTEHDGIMANEIANLKLARCDDSSSIFLSNRMPKFTLEFPSNTCPPSPPAEHHENGPDHDHDDKHPHVCPQHYAPSQHCTWRVAAGFSSTYIYLFAQPQSMHFQNPSDSIEILDEATGKLLLTLRHDSPPVTQPLQLPIEDAFTVRFVSGKESHPTPSTPPSDFAIRFWLGRDCVMSPWTPWPETCWAFPLSTTSSHTITREVILPPTEGGAPCSKNVSVTETCAPGSLHSSSFSRFVCIVFFVCFGFFGCLVHRSVLRSLIVLLSVVTIAGTLPSGTESADGTTEPVDPQAAHFGALTGVATDSHSDIIVADPRHSAVRKIDAKTGLCAWLALWLPHSLLEPVPFLVSFLFFLFFTCSLPRLLLVFALFCAVVSFYLS